MLLEEQVTPLFCIPVDSLYPEKETKLVFKKQHFLFVLFLARDTDSPRSGAILSAWSDVEGTRQIMVAMMFFATFQSASYDNATDNCRQISVLLS